MKEDFNTWKKSKKANRQNIEYFDLYSEFGKKNTPKFRGTITIIKEFREYFCVYEYGGFKVSLNNYPFGNIKQCKDFIQNYHGDLEYMAKHIDLINSKISKFIDLQEKGIIPMTFCYYE